MDLDSPLSSGSLTPPPSPSKCVATETQNENTEPSTEKELTESGKGGLRGKKGVEKRVTRSSAVFEAIKQTSEQDQKDPLKTPLPPSTIIRLSTSIPLSSLDTVQPRIFNFPDIPAIGAPEKELIETPSFRPLSDSEFLGKTRAKPGEGQIELTAAYYEKLHRPFELIEKRAKRIELEKLASERHKLKAEIDKIVRIVDRVGLLKALSERGSIGPEGESKEDLDKRKEKVLKDMEDTLNRYDDLLPQKKTAANPKQADASSVDKNGKSVGSGSQVSVNDEGPNGRPPSKKAKTQASNGPDEEPSQSQGQGNGPPSSTRGGRKKASQPQELPMSPSDPSPDTPNPNDPSTPGTSDVGAGGAKRPRRNVSSAAKPNYSYQFDELDEYIDNPPPEALANIGLLGDSPDAEDNARSASIPKSSKSAPRLPSPERTVDPWGKSLPDAWGRPLSDIITFIKEYEIVPWVPKEHPHNILNQSNEDRQKLRKMWADRQYRVGEFDRMVWAKMSDGNGNFVANGGETSLGASAEAKRKAAETVASTSEGSATFNEGLEVHPRVAGEQIMEIDM